MGLVADSAGEQPVDCCVHGTHTLGEDSGGSGGEGAASTTGMPVVCVRPEEFNGWRLVGTTGMWTTTGPESVLVTAPASGETDAASREEMGGTRTPLGVVV